MTPLLTTKETAAYLKVSPQTVRTRAKRGQIPFVLVGQLRRFDPDAVTAALTDDGPLSPETWRDALKAKAAEAAK